MRYKIKYEISDKNLDERSRDDSMKIIYHVNNRIRTIVRHEIVQYHLLGSSYVLHLYIIFIIDHISTRSFKNLLFLLLFPFLLLLELPVCCSIDGRGLGGGRSRDGGDGGHCVWGFLGGWGTHLRGFG